MSIMLDRNKVAEVADRCNKAGNTLPTYIQSELLPCIKKIEASSNLQAFTELRLLVEKAAKDTIDPFGDNLKKISKVLNETLEEEEKRDKGSIG